MTDEVESTLVTTPSVGSAEATSPPVDPVDEFSPSTELDLEAVVTIVDLTLSRIDETSLNTELTGLVGRPEDGPPEFDESPLERELTTPVDMSEEAPPSMVEDRIGIILVNLIDEVEVASATSDLVRELVNSVAYAEDPPPRSDGASLGM